MSSTISPGIRKTPSIFSTFPSDQRQSTKSKNWSILLNTMYSHGFCFGIYYYFLEPKLKLKFLYLDMSEYQFSNQQIIIWTEVVFILKVKDSISEVVEESKWIGHFFFFFWPKFTSKSLNIVAWLPEQGVTSRPPTRMYLYLSVQQWNPSDLCSGLCHSQQCVASASHC